jgi:DNA-binding transcriptional LysR family regulator
MHIPWEDLEVFLSVAEEHSFSAAARRLGLTQPTVSRRIFALEERLGRALFRRDAEGAHLTEEGTKLHPAAREMGRFGQELSRIAHGFDERPAGIVRIAAPPGTSLDYLVPFAARLRRNLPEIQLHSISGVEHLDLSRGHAELALRSRAPTQPDLMILGRAQVELGVFVSQEYAEELSQAGDGACDLASLRWICWAEPCEHLEPTPTLKKLIPGFEPAFASNDYNVQTRAMALGLGAMIHPKLRSETELYGNLVELSVGLRLPSTELFLVCAKTMRWVPRVRAVAEELLAALTEVEGLTIVDKASF